MQAGSYNYIKKKLLFKPYQIISLKLYIYIYILVFVENLFISKIVVFFFFVMLI